MPQYRALSGSVATTLYRDALTDRSVTAGIQVDSSRYNSLDASFPTKLSGVTLKAEYDERQWTVDTTLKASQYTQAGSSQPTFKLSDASVDTPGNRSFDGLRVCVLD
jgi:hypothetical protein